jgi:hypothetical protein
MARNSTCAEWLTLNLSMPEEQQQQYADAPRSALAQQASATALRTPLSRAESRSMTSPKQGPVAPLEDRYQRPRELIDKYPRGDPYAAGGMSAAPDAPGGQNGSARERTRLDLTTGTSKYAWAATGDRAPSTAEIIRNLSRRENEMMKQIANEISIAVRARWH